MAAFFHISIFQKRYLFYSRIPALSFDQQSLDPPLDNSSKVSGSLWQYYRHEPDLSDAGIIDDFPGNNGSFKFI